MKNILGIQVTKPNHELIILRGLQGVGKSTKAKQLVGSGVIFNLDEYIEKEYDYNEFFEKILVDDWLALEKIYKKMFNEFKIHVEKGINPIILDKTNIRPEESKSFVIHVLENGYLDENIKIIELGTGGLTAKELVERNVHNVPLDVIKSRIDSHRYFSPMTLDKIINSKDKVLYSAVVLDEESRSKLLENFYDSLDVPEDIKLFAHHMTICFGKGLPENLKQDLDKEIILKTTHVGVSNTNLAVQVNGYFSENKIPHITISTKNNGKPVMSNDIVNWVKLPNEIELKGIIKEIKK